MAGSVIAEKKNWQAKFATSMPNFFLPGIVVFSAGVVFFRTSPVPIVVGLVGFVGFVGLPGGRPGYLSGVG